MGLWSKEIEDIKNVKKGFLKLVDPVLVKDCEDLHDVRGVHSADKAE